MTDEELTKRLEKASGKCPHCGSEDLTAGDWDGARVVSCRVTCDDCGATWYEHYRFVSASDFEEE